MRASKEERADMRGVWWLVLTVLGDLASFAHLVERPGSWPPWFWGGPFVPLAALILGVLLAPIWARRAFVRRLRRARRPGRNDYAVRL